MNTMNCPSIFFGPYLSLTMSCSEDDWTDFLNIFLTSFRTIEGNVLDLKVVSNDVQISELEVLQRQIGALNDEVWSPLKVCLFNA